MAENKAVTAKSIEVNIGGVSYRTELTKEKADKLKVGANFREEDLENFNDEQLAQLYELYSEAKKPIDAEKDPHLAS